MVIVQNTCFHLERSLTQLTTVTNTVKQNQKAGFSR